MCHALRSSIFAAIEKLAGEKLAGETKAAREAAVVPGPGTPPVKAAETQKSGRAVLIASIGAGLVLVVLLFVFRKKLFGRRATTTTIALLLSIGFFSLDANAGLVCNVPAGQPFVVTSLSVVPDPANPDAPRRVMVMPGGQERTFRISGCGFGWNEQEVVVGFTGGPAVSVVPPVANDSITVKVRADVSATPSYLNLALRIKGNLIRTPLVLEVVPPQAYAALQAVERHGVGTPSRPAPMVDNTARNAATAAARNAITANDTATKAANASVTIAEKFEKYFGNDGKGGVVGTEVTALREDVEELKKFSDAADTELFYKDGGSRIDDLFERVEALEKKGGTGVSGVSDVSKEDFNKLRADVNAIMAVTVGTVHRGTIGQKAGLVNKAEKPSKKGKGGPVNRPVQ